MDNHKPLISVVTVSFNSAATIQRTFDSLAAQSAYNFEYILVDGGSTDGTLEIASRYGSLISKSVSQPDRGIYDAMNKGIALSSGAYIAFLNSDDAYLPDTLQNVIDVIRKKSPDVVYGNIRKERSLNGETFSRIEKPHLHEMPKTMGVFHPATFVKREFFERFGGFDLRFRLAADYHFMLRVYLAGAAFHYLDEVLAVFTIGGSSNFSCDAYKEAILIQTECNTGHQHAMIELYAKCLKKQRQQRLIAKFARLPILKSIYHNRIKKRWS